MEDMIKRIVDMDKKAREITEAAQREKLNLETTISQRSNELREEYLALARRRIRINRELENVVLEQEWQKTKASYDQQLAAMNAAYETNGEEWVNTLVERVLND